MDNSPSPLSVTVNNSLATESLQATMGEMDSCLTLGTCYVMDVSSWQGPLSLTVPVLGVLYPLLTIITTVFNTIIIYLLTRRDMRSPTNTMLAAIAALDLATLLIQTPWHVHVYTLGRYNTTEWTSTSCYLLNMSTQTLPQICHTTANWLTLGLAGQRYIYICRPHLAKSWCSVPRSCGYIVAAALLSLVHTIPRTVDRAYFSAHLDNRTMCLVKFSPWLTRTSWAMDVYFNSFFWFRVIFVQVLPCLLVTLANIKLLGAMRTANQKRVKMVTTSPTSQTTLRTLRTTKMLVVLNTVFLVVEGPVAILTVLHTISSSSGNDFLDPGTVSRAVLFLNLFIVLSFPVNFAIYCCLSSQFLTEFKSLVGGLKVCKFNRTQRPGPAGNYQRCNSQNTSNMVI